MSIPKVIYQIYLGIDSKYQTQMHANMNAMFQKNPHYEHVLITKESQIVDFIKKYYDNYVLNCFYKLKTAAAKIDFAKYLILYKVGGVYLDTSIYTTNDLDELVKNQAIISIESEKKRYIDNILIFPANHTILYLAVSLMLKYIHMNTYPGDYDNTTGCKLFSKAVRISHFIEYNETLNLERVEKHLEYVYRNRQMSYKIYGLEFNGFFSRSM
jgi:hypothetical protein